MVFFKASEMRAGFLIIIFAWNGFFFSCNTSSRSENPDTAALFALLGGGAQEVKEDPGKTPDPSTEDHDQFGFTQLTVDTQYVEGAQHSQDIKIRFALSNPSAAPIVYKAYLGKPDLMHLNADGVSVTDAISENLTPDAEDPNRFSFSSMETNRYFKIIVIAQSDKEHSAKEIISVPPIPTAGVCAGALPPPAVIGNCEGLCIQTRMNGVQLEAQSRFKNPSVAAIISLDLYLGKPNDEEIQYETVDRDEGNLPPGIYQGPKLNLDTSTYNDFSCVEISSLLQRWSPQFSQNLIGQKVLIPAP